MIRRPPQPWVTLSLFVAWLLVALPGLPPPSAVMHLFILGGLLFASLRWPVAPLAAAALLFAGVDLRLEYARPGSDVLIVTRAAIEHALAGGNPYGVGYAVSTPPGAPFPYGPLTLLWYLPPIPAEAIEFLVATGILLALAFRGHLLGLAVYAAAPVLVVTASDGSNDTSLGLLLLIALVLAARHPTAGAFVLGLAVAFKPTALAWVAGMAGWARVPGLVGMGLGAGIFWLPALAIWGVGPILSSIVGAATLHEWPYYSFAYALQRFGVSAPESLLLATSLAAGAVLAVVSILKVRSIDGVIGWGALIFLVTLFGGFWSTFAYFAALGPIVCWRLDGWLGRAAERVRWPDDPYGRLASWLDERWPALESGAQRRNQ